MWDTPPLEPEDGKGKDKEKTKGKGKKGKKKPASGTSATPTPVFGASQASTSQELEKSEQVFKIKRTRVKIAKRQVEIGRASCRERV